MNSDRAQPPTSLRRAADPLVSFPTRATIVAVEAILLTVVFGETIVAIPRHLIGYEGSYLGKLVLFFAMVGAVLWTHFLGCRAEYREQVPPRWTLLCNAAVFLVVVATLAGVSSGAAASLLGERGGSLLLLGLLAIWLTTVVVAWAPDWTAIPTIVGRIVFVFTVLLLARFLGFFTSLYWRVTSEPTLRLVQWCLTPFAGDPVLRPEPYTIGTQAFSVKIFDSCSGHAGIGLITAVLTGYLWWFRDLHRFPQSLLLFPVGVVLSYLANVVRITALILVGIWISPEIADGGFHSQAGWIMFLVVATTVIGSARRMPFFTRTALFGGETTGEPVVDASGERVPATLSTRYLPTVTACLVPFLVLGATGMLTAAFTSGLNRFYPLRVIAVAWALWRLRGQFPTLPASGVVSPGAIGIGACTFALWMALEHGGGAADPDEVAALDPALLGEPWGTLWLLFRVAGYTITVPIAEELAFRGFLTRRCIDEDIERVPVGAFTWLSFAVSSVAFGLLHWPSWIAGTIAGVAFALALYQRRRLADAIAAHATTNALLSVWVIGTGTWNGWG